jgi:hypothetical protein
VGGKRLTAVNVVNGRTRQFPLDAIAGGESSPRICVAVDGPMVYLTGPAGVLCVNPATGWELFHALWPKGAGPVPAAAPPSGTPSRARAGWPGTPARTSLYRALYGGRSPSTFPKPDCVADGVLYATPLPWRVVALVEKTQ